MSDLFVEIFIFLLVIILLCAIIMFCLENNLALDFYSNI